MAQIGYDPATGALTLDGQKINSNDPRLWGAVGRNVLDVNTAAPGAYGAGNYDSKYYEPYQESMGDAGEQTFYRLRPEYAQKIGNSTQISSGGYGGYGEPKDPSKLVWDDEFGVLTDRNNINEPGGSNFINKGGIFALMAAPFLGPMALEALSGSGGVSSAAGYGLGGSAGEAAAAGGMGGMGGGVGGAAGLATDIAPGYLAESVAPQVTEAMAGSPFGGNSLWQSAMNYATSNPLSAARGVAGLLGAAGSAGGSQQTTGASGGFQGPPVGQFNPVGNAGQFQSNQSQYQPMQFDPVPFMGGSMYYNQQQPNFMGSWGGFNQNAMNFGGGYTPAQYQGGGGPAQGYQMSGYGMGQSGQPFMSSPFGMGQQQPQQPKPYMPPQFNMNQQQPQQGGLLGNVQTMAGGQPDGFGPNNPGQNPHYGRYANNGAFVADPSAGASQMDQSPLVPGMTNREVMGYARYLPGNKSPLDPLVSQNLLQKSGGNWQSMVPQRAQAGFQQFMNAFGNPQSFGDYQNFLKAR